MKHHIVLPANHPIPRVDHEGREFNVLFQDDAIKDIFESFKGKSEVADFGLYLNVESDPRFDKDIPVGSLMAERGPCSYEFKIEPTP